MAGSPLAQPPKWAEQQECQTNLLPGLGEPSRELALRGARFEAETALGRSSPISLSRKTKKEYGKAWANAVEMRFVDASLRCRMFESFLFFALPTESRMTNVSTLQRQDSDSGRNSHYADTTRSKDSCAQTATRPKQPRCRNSVGSWFALALCPQPGLKFGLPLFFEPSAAASRRSCGLKTRSSRGFFKQ